LRPPPLGLAAILLVATLAAPSAAPRQTVFKGGVNLVNVTATVTDQDGRFVQGLRKEDFVIYDDETPQEIVQFTSERVPVSLGVLLDVSGSMTEEKMASARAAITRFAYDHLAPDDELFLAEFASRTEVLQTWTRDRGTFSRALDRTRQGRQRFGTAVYDAVREALFMASTGTHTKKALLVISDGQDTRSRTPA
jgi:Ca-activated chloride channel family protein